MTELDLALGKDLIRIDCRHPYVESALRAAWQPALQLGSARRARGETEWSCHMTFESDGRWWIDGTLRRSDPHFEDRLPQLESFIVKEMLPRQRQTLHLHAGCVVFGQTPMLFCGRSGAGKSTFSRLSVSAGASYMTDDCLLIQDGYARGVARSIQFDGLEPEDNIPEHLADCDVSTYLSMSDRDVYRRIPLWRGRFETIETWPTAAGPFEIVELRRGSADEVVPLSSIERLAILHAATVTVGKPYEDQLGFGPSYRVTWNDPRKAFARLCAHFEKGWAER